MTLAGRVQGLRHLANAPFAGLGRTRLDQVVRCNCVYVLFSRLPGFLRGSVLASRSRPARFKLVGNRKHYDAAVQPRDWRQAWPPQVEREAYVAVLDSGPQICFLLQGPPPPLSARPATPGPTLPPQVQGGWAWGGWYCRVAGWNQSRAGGGLGRQQRCPKRSGVCKGYCLWRMHPLPGCGIPDSSVAAIH